MSTEETGTGVTPEDCELERFERNHYFDGKLLTARDMADEQAYHVDRLATLARYVLGDGIVCGLSVTVEHTAGDEDVTVHVSPGMALDCCGNLVVLEDGATEEFAVPATSGDASDPDPELYLYLRYRECFRESVPIPNSGDACEEACEFNRVLEVYDVVAESSPLGDGVDPSTGTMEFPVEEDLVAREPAVDLEGDDPELLRLARTYHERERDTCPDCEDPHVYLCRLEPDGDGVWDVVADSGTDFVFSNELLYAAISRHSADFRNPHETSLTVLDAVVSGDDSSARVMVEDEATDAEAVTLSSDTDYIRITTPGTPSDDRTVALTTPGIDDLADRVTALETRVTEVEDDVADNTTAIGENASDIADNATDIADNAADIDRLERYVMDKTLKYKAECFGGLAETFDGTVAGDVAAAVLERTWAGIDARVYEDPDEFREFVGEDTARHPFDRVGLNAQEGDGTLVVTLGDHQFVVVLDEYDGDVRETDDGFEVDLTLVELERLVGDALVGLSRPSREDAMPYDEALSGLEDALEDGTPLDVAIAQDLVCETAEWLEAVGDVGVPGVLTAETDPDTVATGVDDPVTISGTAVGQGDDVRVYLVGPGGDYLVPDGTAGATTADVDGEAFARAYTAFEEPGPYVFLVAGRGRDGDYASDIGFDDDQELPTGLSQAEAVDAVLSSYGDDDADDPVVRVDVTGERPSLDIEDFTSARRGTVVVQGTTNRADGTTVNVRLRSLEDTAPILRDTTTTAADGEWVVSFDLSDAGLGQYRVSASAGPAGDEQAFTLLPRFTRPDIDDVVIPDDVVVADDFTVLSGVGEARAEALDAAGFRTMRDVAEANPGELAGELGISRRLAREIVREAEERRIG